MIACWKTRWATMANYLMVQALVLVVAGYFAILPLSNQDRTVDAMSQRAVVSGQAARTASDIRYYAFYEQYDSSRLLPQTKKQQSYMNSSGMNLVKFYEGFRATPYRDAAGHRTIGYGHKIRRGERFTKITRHEAEQLLAKDMLEAEMAVQKNIRVPLTTNQYAALVSFAYNVGSYSFKKSTLARKLNAGNYNAVPTELRRWVKAADKPLHGLKKRREAEIALFRTRDYAYNDIAQQNAGEL